MAIDRKNISEARVCEGSYSTFAAHCILLAQCAMPCASGRTILFMISKARTRACEAARTSRHEWPQLCSASEKFTNECVGVQCSHAAAQVRRPSMPRTRLFAFRAVELLNCSLLSHFYSHTELKFENRLVRNSRVVSRKS